MDWLISLAAPASSRSAYRKEACGGRWRRMDVVQRDQLRGSHLGVCWWSCQTLAWHRRPVRETNQQTNKKKQFLSLRSQVASGLSSGLLKFCSATDGRRGGWEEVRERRPRGREQDDCPQRRCNRPERSRLALHLRTLNLLISTSGMNVDILDLKLLIYI